MDLGLINANVNRLLANIWAIIGFLREFAVDDAKDVSITYQNADGAESVKTFPNIAKMTETNKVEIKTIEGLYTITGGLNDVALSHKITLNMFPYVTAAEDAICKLKMRSMYLNSERSIVVKNILGTDFIISNEGIIDTDGDAIATFTNRETLGYGINASKLIISEKYEHLYDIFHDSGMGDTDLDIFFKLPKSTADHIVFLEYTPPEGESTTNVGGTYYVEWLGNA